MSNRSTRWFNKRSRRRDSAHGLSHTRLGGLETLEPRLPLAATGISLNVELLSQVAVDQFDDTSTWANDLSSYLSPSGREYAILGLQRGIGFVEITDPRNPVVVATLAGPDEPVGDGLSAPVAAAACLDECDSDGQGVLQGEGSIWRDIKVNGQYAYTVNERGGGVQIIDMGRIDEGIVTIVETDSQIGPNKSHNVTIDAGVLFISGGNNTNGTGSGNGLLALDVATDPERPQVLGVWNENRVHDSIVVSYTEGPAAGRQIAYAFAARAGVKVIDVTDPANMTTLSTLVYPNLTFAHFGAISDDGQFLFINDELDEKQDNVASTTTYLADISDPLNPQFVTSFTNGQIAIDHNLTIRGDLLFEANYQSGLRVYDVSNAADAVEVGYYDTFDGNETAFDGAWGVDSSLPSGVVLVSDFSGGLFIFDVSALEDDGLRGDLDHDNRVGRSDVVLMLAQFGETGTSGDDGDLQGDGRVGLSDVAILQAVMFQATPSAAPAPAMVEVPPTPGSHETAIRLRSRRRAIRRSVARDRAVIDFTRSDELGDVSWHLANRLSTVRAMAVARAKS